MNISTDQDILKQLDTELGEEYEERAEWLVALAQLFCL